MLELIRRSRGSLTKITVKSKLRTLHTIEFTYSTDRIPAQNYKLGHPISTDYVHDIVCFSIDGPSGEIIETVDVYIENMTDGVLQVFNVSL